MNMVIYSCSIKLEVYNDRSLLQIAALGWRMWNLH